MNRRQKKILISFAVVLGGLAIMLFAVRRFTAKMVEEASKGTVLNLTADKIAEIECPLPDGSRIRYVRRDGIWYVSDADGNTNAESGTSEASTSETAPSEAAASVAASSGEEADSEKVSELAASLTGNGISQIITRPSSLADYGLSEGAAEVEVVDADGNTITITIGSQNETTQDVYCLINGNEALVYAVEPSLIAMAEECPGGLAFPDLSR